MLMNQRSAYAMAEAIAAKEARRKALRKKKQRMLEEGSVGDITTVVRWVQSRQLKHYRCKSNVVLLYCLDYLQRMSTGFLRLARLCFSEFHYVSKRYAFLFWLAHMLVTVSICTSRHCLMLHSGRCRALVNHFFVCLIIANTLLASGGIARGVLEGPEWFVSK